MIYHLRKRLPKKGGNQWYLDNRIRKSETYCGADCTDADSDWRSNGETWTRDNVFVLTYQGSNDGFKTTIAFNKREDAEAFQSCVLKAFPEANVELEEKEGEEMICCPDCLKERSEKG